MRWGVGEAIVGGLAEMVGEPRVAGLGEAAEWFFCTAKNFDAIPTTASVPTSQNRLEVCLIGHPVALFLLYSPGAFPTLFSWGRASPLLPVG